MKAIKLGMTTLVGFVDKNYPTDCGNCFSVLVDEPEADEELCHAYDRISRRVANMHYENFVELLRRKIIEFPVEVTELNERYCAITDPRVPEEWKLTLETACNLCRPMDIHESMVAPYMRRFCSECGAGLDREDEGQLCSTCIGEHERGVR